MDQAKNTVNSGSAAAMLSEMKSKLRLKSTQVSQIRPEIEKYVKERKDLETSKMADQAKLKSMKVLNESFDGKIKAVLSKIQWTKYLEWIRKFRA